MPKQRVPLIRLIIILTSMLLTVAGCPGCTKKTAEKVGTPALKPVAVKTAAAKEGSVTPSLVVTGTVAGDKEIQLTAKTQGTITALYVRAGDRVHAGQVVAVLESENQRLMVEKANEAVAAARINLEKAKVAFSRADQLYSQEAISRAEWENARFMLESAQVAYNAALADYRLANETLDDTTVVAPFTGSVVECAVEKGATVFPGKEVVTVVDDARLKVKANLNAGQLKLVAKGQQGVFTTAVYPDKEFPCTVKLISSTANPANRTYAVELSLPPDANRYLKLGMFGHVQLRTTGKKGTIIPRDAVITRNETGKTTVFVVREGKARYRTIRTGENDAKNILVTEGLKPGERVVVFGQHLLKEGMPVTEGA
ncbi:MAG: efflux RND transporter periplasmic adaptor subunit [Bacillota bacterium]